MASLKADDLSSASPGLHSPFLFPSTKGGLKVAYMGYTYVKEKTLKNGNIAFRCDYPNKQCKGRLTINSTANNKVSQQPQNMHAPHQAAVEVSF